MALRATVALAFLLGASVLPPPATAQQPTAPTADAKAMETARSIIGAARYATLVTVGTDGVPQARIVDPLTPDSEFVVYVATNPRSRKVAEIRANPRVSLLYFDQARGGYATIVGRAEVAGPAEKPRQHKDAWQQFFPRERPSDYVLYRVEPTRIEVVSPADGLGGDPVTWRAAIVNLPRKSR